MPTPAVLGATALIIAGGGAVIVSSNSGGTDGASDAAAAAQLSGDAATYARGGGVLPVSRSLERDTKRQAKEYARQWRKAQAQLATQTQKVSDEIEANQWVLPVVGYELSAGYGEISSLWSSYHTGLDFSCGEGTLIKSVAHGTVTSVGYDDSYGYKVEVTLDDGTTIWYAHQLSYEVSEGQEVNPGDLIGYVGSTGNTTGPHLHLEVRIPDGSDDGQDVDPVPEFAKHGVIL